MAMAVRQFVGAHYKHCVNTSLYVGIDFEIDHKVTDSYM